MVRASLSFNLMDFLSATEGMTDEQMAQFIKDLRRCLIDRNKEISAFGAEILERYERKRSKERDRKRAQREKKKNIGQDKKEVEKIKRIEEKFEVFRKAYPGTKLGLKTELKNFLRQAGDEAEKIIDQLMPALEREIEYRERKAKSGGFVPEWKHLRTWINNRCWEQTFSDAIQRSPEERRADEYREMMRKMGCGQSLFSLPQSSASTVIGRITHEVNR